MPIKPTKTDPKLAALLERAKDAPPMTPAQIQEQRISFVYGQLPHDNPLTKDDIRRMDYERYGNLQDEK